MFLVSGDALMYVPERKHENPQIKVVQPRLWDKLTQGNWENFTSQSTNHYTITANWENFNVCLRQEKIPGVKKEKL